MKTITGAKLSTFFLGFIIGFLCCLTSFAQKPEAEKDHRYRDPIRFEETIHKQLPNIRIYVLSIKPSIRRWEMWPQMKEANRIIEKECSKDNRLTYIDITTGMLNGNGQPRREIFLEDNLHMNRSGYIIWRDIIRPILLKTELPYEQGNQSHISCNTE
jgi:hypothetical protein